MEQQSDSGSAVTPASSRQWSRQDGGATQMENEIITLTRLDVWARGRQVREVLRDALVNFSREKSFLVSASIAYYSLLALFPMLLLLLSVSGAFIHRYELSGRLVLVLGHYLPFRADFIKSNLVEISHAREELQRLSASIVAAQEDERRSISRELHDEVGQALTGVLVELANLSTLIRIGDYETLSGKTAEIKREVEASIGVVRNMALLLRPSMLDDLGLVPALQWQAREVSKRAGVWVKVSAAGVDELPEKHKTCVYRIVQEALHNAVQHAAARTVTVTVAQQNERLQLAIEDDGKGFDPQLTKGMGILGMEERVSHLNGAFSIESEPGRGTIVHVDLPLSADARTAFSAQAQS